MKRFFLRSGLFVGTLLLAMVLVFFGGNTNGAPPLLQAASCGLMNQTTTPFAYLSYQTGLRSGMSVSAVQERLTGKGNLYQGYNYTPIRAALPENFTGDLKLHDGLSGMVGDEGSTWLAMTFVGGSLQTTTVLFNQG